MRIDNTAWGSRDFVEELNNIMMDRMADKEESIRKAAELLAARIEALKKSDESVKYLYYALQEKQQEASSCLSTLSALMKAQHDTLRSIISNMRA